MEILIAKIKNPTVGFDPSTGETAQLRFRAIMDGCETSIAIRGTENVRIFILQTGVGTVQELEDRKVVLGQTGTFFEYNGLVKD